MTLLTTRSKVSYYANPGDRVFPYTFRVDEKEHMNVYIDGVILDPGRWSITGLGDAAGGSVNLNEEVPPIIENPSLVSLVRLVPPTQEVDYQPFDAFPSQTHEGALDKLTMLVQQASNEVVNAIRVPITEEGADVNLTVPPARERAEKFLYFDADGNVTAFDAELAAPAVYRIDIQDGTGGEDSRDMLQVETVTGGPNYPKLGIRNINKPRGMVQLNDQGKVPFELLQIIGIKIFGPFRGDNLCDKPGDEVGDCTAPDYRNPSERFPDIQFESGDTFIISLAEGEVSGNMNLFADIGDDTPSLVEVNLRDSIIYLEEVLDPNDGVTVIIQEGWYHVPKLIEVGDASFIIYDDTGNTYVLGANVQVALDAIDSHLLERDDWYVTQRSNLRPALTSADANSIMASGMYALGSASSNLPTAHDYTITHISLNTDNMTQTATNITNGDVYVRTYALTGWSDWTKQLDADDLINLVVPVGIVRSFMSSIDPNVIYQGTTWERLPNETFLMNGTIGNSGGTNSQTISVDNMPSHSHGINDPGHGHAYDRAVSGADGWVEGGAPRETAQIGPGTTELNTTGISIQNSGNGQPFDNRPAFIEVAMWQRTA